MLMPACLEPSGIKAHHASTWLGGRRESHVIHRLSKLARGIASIEPTCQACHRLFFCQTKSFVSFSATQRRALTRELKFTSQNKICCICFICLSFSFLCFTTSMLLHVCFKVEMQVSRLKANDYANPLMLEASDRPICEQRKVARNFGVAWRDGVC